MFKSNNLNSLRKNQSQKYFPSFVDSQKKVYNSSFVSKISLAKQQNGNSSNEGLIFIENYFDYTDKYGVGYVLSNGIIGFYFNDMTNLLLLEQTQQYAYNDFYKRPQKEGVVFYSFADFPKEWAKKEKIIKQFKLYFNKIKEEKKLKTKIVTLPEVAEFSKSIVAVKQVVKTKNGIMMKLTNSVAQMAFADITQIVIYFKIKTLISVNKKGEKEILRMSNGRLLTSNEGIIKRFKYALNILSMLRSTKPGKQNSAKRKTDRN